MLRKKNSSVNGGRISDLLDIDFTSLPVNNNVLTYDSNKLKWIPKSLPTAGEITGSSTYLIELARWGITQGLPTKRIETINSVNVNCYSDADYIKAYNNIIGFNNAIEWAHTNGYRKMVVPFGNYSICYSLISDNDKENAIIIDKSNFSLDLNGSTFKVIYDSAKRSPFDKIKSGSVYTTNTAPTYMFGNGGRGGVFTIRDCNYSELRNGVLIGDKVDRDFTVQEEKANEQTYGIAAGGNCKYINVENMDVSFFMGDGVTICNGKNIAIVKVGYQMAWQLGDLDTNGTFATSTTRCVSDYISVNSNIPHFLQGYGFTQGMTALKNKKYTVYFYDINKVFITKESAFVIKDFTTTKLTKFVRLVVEESVVDVEGWQMSLKSGTIGSYLTYQNNYIHHNHRGGMSPGVNDMFILNNIFYNNGELRDYENNLPGFEQTNGVTFSTRYHINMEDAQGFNIHIIGNKFENGRLGIAARGYNYTIKDNWFKDCIGVILYRIHYATVKDNYFDNSSFDTYPYDSAYNSLTDYFRHWSIEGNTIEGSLTINGTAIVNSISNNTITGSVKIGSKVRVFKNNVFKLNTDFSFGNLVALTTVDNIEGCSFIKNDQSTINNTIQLESSVISNCTFKNIKVRVKDVNMKNCLITDSGFEVADGFVKMDDCKISHGTYMLKNNYAITPDNSALLNITDNNKPILVEFKNCDIISTSTNNIFASVSNALTNASLKLENTNIGKKANNKLGVGIFNGTLNFINSIISSEVAVSNITPNAALAHRFSDCVFTNVSFTVKTSDILYSQQDIGVLAKPLTGNGSPISAPNKIGQEYYDLTNKKLYKAFGNTATSDWVIMN